jgi:flavin reductase (DIM6/NTAB) family NADH-FMN oxidoreductase RutF
MPEFNPKEISPARLQQILTACVAPRPIAFVCTLNAEGIHNLSPFSFFNVFSNNPPVLVFSPSRRVRDNTTKHTYHNLLQRPEACISMVSMEMVQQASLSSTEYPEGMDEFVKAGFEKLPSSLIAPCGVAESPVQMECKVKSMLELGTGGGAGILVICEVMLIRVNERVMEEGKIIQDKLRLVSRLGENFYGKAFGDALFEVEKPLSTLGIGVDRLPAPIRLSKVLTGNHLGQLGNVESLPDKEAVLAFKNELPHEWFDGPEDMTDFVHATAAKYLDMQLVGHAWKTLLAYHGV